jgi:hypothetical protein
MGLREAQKGRVLCRGSNGQVEGWNYRHAALGFNLERVVPLRVARRAARTRSVPGVGTRRRLAFRAGRAACWVTRGVLVTGGQSRRGTQKDAIDIVHAKEPTPVATRAASCATAATSVRRRRPLRAPPCLLRCARHCTGQGATRAGALIVLVHLAHAYIRAIHALGYAVHRRRPISAASVLFRSRSLCWTMGQRRLPLLTRFWRPAGAPCSSRRREGGLSPRGCNHTHGRACAAPDAKRLFVAFHWQRRRAVHGMPGARRCTFENS